MPVSVDDRLSRIAAPILKELIFKEEITKDDLEAILKMTVEKIVHSLFAESITLYFLEGDKINFKYVYFSPVLYKADENLKKAFDEKRQKLLSLSLPAGTGIVGKVIADKKTSLISDVSKSSEFYGGVDADTGFKTKSTITVPLISKDKAFGAIQVINKAIPPYFFSEADSYLLEEVAQYSSKIIQKAIDPLAKLTEQEFAYYVARFTKQQYIELGESFSMKREILDEMKMTTELLKKFRMIPMKILPGKSVRMILANPLDYNQVEDFEVVTGWKIKEMVVASKTEINYAIKKYFDELGEPFSEEESLAGKMTAELTEESEKEEELSIEESEEMEKEDSAPIIKLANQLIREAYNKRASDIHIEAFEKETSIRYRVDGVLRQFHKLPRSSHNALVARYKIMSGLNIAERRRPQDGRIRFRSVGKENPDIELRVSIAPLVWGEKVVMRILDKQATLLGLDSLGFSERNLAYYREAIKKPYGMILNVGPTGSGKTTTLYSALAEINKPGINIQTAEDPVEYNLPGINQMPVRKDIGVNFADALRCFLRQDPDVIMVGEIRDLETAEVAVEAALTGHLVLSTLHTNDAATTITRFIDMGVEPFLISSSLLLICAQRLVRRLCDCKTPQPADEALASSLGIPPGTTLYRANGCSKCENTGYKGRCGVHEILVLDEELRHLIVKKGITADEISDVAVKKDKMVPLFRDGIEKAIKGITSIDEVFRVLKSE